MWYFSWILGLALACCFAIMTGIWYELRRTEEKGEALTTEATSSEDKEAEA